jgi:uncharacterized protein DUF5372
LPSSVRIARPRHPFEGQPLQVLGGMRRHGVLELLLVLPDGSKSLVPAGWTDAERSVADGETAATLGALIDLLQVCELVADLAGRRRAERGQAAGKSPCEEDFHAACPAQSDARPRAGATGAGATGADRGPAGRRDGALWPVVTIMAQSRAYGWQSARKASGISPASSTAP